MKSSIALGIVALFVVAAVSLARVVPTPQGAVEETISGPISATRTIMQNARLTGDVTCTVQSAPCVQFGVAGITLNLNGFTMTGLGDASTGCQGSRVGNATLTVNEDGLAAINQSDVTIQGPGLVQRFRGDGIFVLNSVRVRIVDVTSTTNCQSGILMNSSSDSHLEGNVSVRNGTNLFPCGGL